MPDDADFLTACVAHASLIRKRVVAYPADDYEPHATVFREGGARPVGASSGQLQFHEARHPIRIAAPGNGWGGTMALACEIDSWMRHLDRWQTTATWPILAIWFCPEFRQLSILLHGLIPSAFGSTPRFVTGGFGGPRFVWPDGGTLYFASYDRSWTHLQGIEPDLISFDEQPPENLWREMQQRRRGKRKARYICKATQTAGRSWMAEDIYEPWLQHHAELGLDEQQACDEQQHPTIWCWPMGSVHDNPAMDAQDLEWYETRPWPTEKERKVRVWGGFEDWAGDSVFDAEGMEWLRRRARELNEEMGPGTQGSFAVAPSDDLPPMVTGRYPLRG